MNWWAYIESGVDQPLPRTRHQAPSSTVWIIRAARLFPRELSHSQNVTNQFTHSLPEFIGGDARLLRPKGILDGRRAYNANKFGPQGNEMRVRSCDQVQCVSRRRH